ncbi:hypothetical protein E4U54_001153, partial [Claviceps lovelessii]
MVYRVAGGKYCGIVPEPGMAQLPVYNGRAYNPTWAVLFVASTFTLRRACRQLFSWKSLATTVQIYFSRSMPRPYRARWSSSRRKCVPEQDGPGRPISEP